CFGLYSKALPQTFIDRGASVVLGWNGLVTVSYVDEATLHLLKALCLEKLSIKEAVEAVMREIGPDPENHSILSYYPLEKSELTLLIPYYRCFKAKAFSSTSITFIVTTI
ncbi:MAG: hypothetical protein QW693_04275, partial [Candidatus Bathyarchaeia archaeon]